MAEWSACGAGSPALQDYRPRNSNHCLNRRLVSRLEVKNTGIDIVEVARIRRALECHGRQFVGRILTAREASEIGLGSSGPLGGGNPVAAAARIAPRIAARFAAKEAVAKAIGCGISGFSWKDIEILRREGEPPRVELARRALEAASARKIGSVMVSMSHTRTYAVAQAVAQGE